MSLKTKNEINCMKKSIALLLSLFPLIIFSQEKGLDEKINDAFEPVAHWWESLILSPVSIAGHNMPYRHAKGHSYEWYWEDDTQKKLV